MVVTEGDIPCTVYLLLGLWMMVYWEPKKYYTPSISANFSCTCLICHTLPHLHWGHAPPHLCAASPALRPCSSSPVRCLTCTEAMLLLSCPLPHLHWGHDPPPLWFASPALRPCSSSPVRCLTCTEAMILLPCGLPHLHWGHAPPYLYAASPALRPCSSSPVLRRCHLLTCWDKIQITI